MDHNIDQELLFGYKFMPTDEELINYYLSKKICNEALPFHIHEVDVSEYSPDRLIETLPLIGKDEWFFFTSRNQKYEGGTQPDRKSGNGFWRESTGYMPIRHEGETIGYRRLLKFFIGEHNKGESTQWNMFEYTIDNNGIKGSNDCALCKMHYCSYKPRKTMNKRKALTKAEDDESTMIVNGDLLIASDQNHMDEINDNGFTIVDEHCSIESTPVNVCFDLGSEERPLLPPGADEGQDCLFQGGSTTTTWQQNDDEVYSQIDLDALEFSFDFDDIDRKLQGRFVK